MTARSIDNSVNTMKHYLLGIIIFLFVTGCGGGGGSSTTPSAGKSTTTTTTGTGSAVQVTATDPLNYVWTTLSAGKNVYIDRSYVYTAVPAEFDGLMALQTANDDKTSTGSSFITFTIDQATTVYVAYVDIAPPSWMDASWVMLNIDTSIGTSDRTLFLFKKEFQAGTVVLGGNESVPSMYAVYVGTAGVSTGGSPSAGCVSCANGVNLSLSWNANADEITGYRVYMGNSNTTVNTEIKDIPKISASFDAANPNITFDAGVDLKLNHGDTACFAIKAYSNYGLSPASDAVCKTL